MPVTTVKLVAIQRVVRQRKQTKEPAIDSLIGLNVISRIFLRNLTEELPQDILLPEIFVYPS